MTAGASTTARIRSIQSAGPDLGPAIAKHIDTAFREFLRGPEVHKEPGFCRIITKQPHPFGNFAVASELRDPLIIASATEPLCSLIQPSAVLLAGDAISPDVLDCLRSRGFTPHEPMPAMAIDIPNLAPTSLPDEYMFQRIGSSAGRRWAECFAAGYEVPPRVAELFSPINVPASPDPAAHIQFFAIAHAGELVATSLLYLKDGYAGIYCVSTLPKHRGRGLGAHATAEPLRIASKLGYGVGVLQSSAMGESVYRRLGFGTFGDVPLWVRMPT